MVISYAKRHIFIEVPKTASSSVSTALLRSDKTAVRNKVEIAGVTVEVPTHITARKLCRLLGEQFSEFYRFGVRRDESARKASAYRFYRHGRASRNVLKRPFNLRRFANVTLAKALPYAIWKRVHPHKPCERFTQDAAGNFLLDEVAEFDDLPHWWRSICERLGVEPSKLPHENRTA